MAVEACAITFMGKILVEPGVAITVPAMLSLLCADPKVSISVEHNELLGIIRHRLGTLTSAIIPGTETYTYTYPKGGINTVSQGAAGSCGSVYFGSPPDPRRAYKVEIGGDLSDQSLLKALIEGFLTEVANTMSPTCVPAFYGIYKVMPSSSICIVIEYIEGQLTHEYIANHVSKAEIFTQLREKINLFHQGNVHLCHNDLHFGNAMVKTAADLQVYILDWGYATLTWMDEAGNVYVIGVRSRTKSNGFDLSLAMYGACLYDLHMAELQKEKENRSLEIRDRYMLINNYRLTREELVAIVGQYTVDIEGVHPPYNKFNLLLFLHTTWAWNTDRIPFNFQPWMFIDWMHQCFQSKYLWGGDASIANLFRTAIKNAPILNAIGNFEYKGKVSLGAQNTVAVLSRYFRPNTWITRTIQLVGGLFAKAAAGMCRPKISTVIYTTTEQSIGKTGNARHRAVNVLDAIAAAKADAREVDTATTLIGGPLPPIPENAVPLVIPTIPIIEKMEQAQIAVNNRTARLMKATASFRHHQPQILSRKSASGSKHLPSRKSPSVSSRLPIPSRKSRPSKANGGRRTRRLPRYRKA